MKSENKLFESLIGKLLNLVEFDADNTETLTIQIEAMKLLQDLSIIANNGYESLFKPVLSSIISSTLTQDNSKALQQMLILKEHAILTVGNLIFDSNSFC